MPFLLAMAEQETNQSVESLMTIWRVTREEAERVAAKLVAIGFFERRTTRADPDPDYWVPFLYRSALRMVQGSADESDESAQDGADEGA